MKTEKETNLFIFIWRLVWLQAKQFIDLDQHVNTTIAQNSNDNSADNAKYIAGISKRFGHSQNSRTNISFKQGHQRLKRCGLMSRCYVGHAFLLDFLHRIISLIMGFRYNQNGNNLQNCKNSKFKISNRDIFCRKSTKL